MSLTYEEMKERLVQVDVVSLLEVLNISSEDIVARFDDKIEDRYEYLIFELQDEETED